VNLISPRVKAILGAVLLYAIAAAPALAIVVVKR